MSIIDKKKEVFGNIAAARTLTEGLPNLKLTSSQSSINNNGNTLNFLTDLIKSLIGFEQLVSSVVDILTHNISLIETDVKKTLKSDLKGIVSCGVDPHLPQWATSTGSGVVIEVNKIDFMDILRIDPNSVGGQLIYNDTTSLLNSSDFNTFLYGVIQDDGNTHTWKNILDITFNSLGQGTRPNNSLTIRANSNYNNKTLTDLNNNFIDSLTLFNTQNILNSIMDIIYGSISSVVGKSLKQLENEARINTIIDKMINNVNENPINDSDFSFTNEEISTQQTQAINRKKGTTQLNTSNSILSSVPITHLTDFTQQISGTTSSIDKKAVITSSLNSMANSSTSNVTNKTDVPSVKLNFIQLIIDNIIKAIVGSIISPKVVMAFVLNYKIVYGPTATYDDGVDFIKKNKNLMNSIMKGISEELIKLLLTIALKEIASLAASAIASRKKERAQLKSAQLESLNVVPDDTIETY